MIKSIEQGRKEDGNRSIADKIIKRLHDLEMTVENNHGRWAWELLQNAKDSIADCESERKVSVEIELSENSVAFRHNGKHFTEKDVRGLINQISSKEVEEGEESNRTGKFGTGFLTTHLLSKVIEVESIVETIDKDFFRFSFPLDRNGKTTTQLVPKIENAWASFHKSTEGNQINDFDENDFNTSFVYNLGSEEQQDIARIGVNEFSELIPFVLAFIPTIATVAIIDKIKNTNTKFENSEELIDDVLLNIIKTENKKQTKIHLLFAKADDVAIASIVEAEETGYRIKNLKKIPKLFCDFPLIGTEDFHFPVIVNSFYFNPLMEREGVWLKGEGKKEVEENRDIIKKAVTLYEELLGKITELNFVDYHNICVTKTPNTSEKHFDDKWYESEIQKPLREIIKVSKVVETETETVTVDDVRFPDPDLKKEEREIIWQFSSDLKVNTLPAKRHIHNWAELIWEDCSVLDIAHLVADLKSKANLKELINTLETDESQALAWLNNCIDFIFHVGGQVYFNNNELIPNQEGTFRKRKELSTDEIDDDKLKEIASLLEYNYYEDLIHNGISFEESHSKTTKQDVAIEITNSIKEKDKDKNYQMNADDIAAIRMLTEWFEHNEEDGKILFAELYRKKEKLFVDTIDDKENLYRVFKSKTKLSKLADIAEAIKNNPEILVAIENLMKEKQELGELKVIGEYFEIVLEKALREYGFEVENVFIGKDLIITLKKSKKKYFIEVKSTRMRDFVAMTSAQGKEASNNSDNYALCVIYNDGTIPTPEYVKKNAKLILDIGERLKNKVDNVVELENNYSEISSVNEDIVLAFENGLNYKYQISNKIWEQGINFKDFIKHINELETANA